MTPVFVFGSNLAGAHGAGAALEARCHWGAQPGVGEGLTGDSYALPTKNYQIKTRPLSEIAESIERFTNVAEAHPKHYFFVTRIGCGLAGYTDADIAPLFARAATLPNVGLCLTWIEILNDQTLPEQFT